MKQRELIIFTLILALGLPVAGQDLTPPPAIDSAPPVAVPPAPTQPPPPPTLTLSSAGPLTAPAREVVKMASSGVPDDVLKAYIANSGSTFNLTPDGIINLQTAGVSTAVTAEMLTHDKALRDMASAMAQQQAMPPGQAYPGAVPPPDYGYVPPQSSVQVTDIPNPDYNPYGSWQYGADYGWYWQPYSWVGYPWGVVGFNSGRWWQHPRVGMVWSRNSQFRGARGAFGNQPFVIHQHPASLGFTTGAIRFTTGNPRFTTSAVVRH